MAGLRATQKDRRKMAKERVKTREISIAQSKGNFLIFKIPGSPKKSYDFKGVSDLKQVLSREKARILNAIRNQNPSSIYELSKNLGRSFKSVSDDIKLLRKFGLVELKSEQTKKRKRLKPVLATDVLKIQIKL